MSTLLCFIIRYMCFWVAEKYMTFYIIYDRAIKKARKWKNAFILSFSPEAIQGSIFSQLISIAFGCT